MNKPGRMELASGFPKALVFGTSSRHPLHRAYFIGNSTHWQLSSVIIILPFFLLTCQSQQSPFVIQFRDPR